MRVDAPANGPVKLISGNGTNGGLRFTTNNTAKAISELSDSDNGECAIVPQLKKHKIDFCAFHSIYRCSSASQQAAALP